MNELNLLPTDRAVVQPALDRSELLAHQGMEGDFRQVVSIELEDGRMHYRTSFRQYGHERGVRLSSERSEGAGRYG